MQKILLSLLLIFPTLLCAEGSLSSYQLGYSSNSTNSVTSTDTGGFYTNVDFLSTSSSGFGIGVGFDLNTWGARSTQYSTDATMFSMGGTAKLGYTFQSQYNIPLKLKAGIGYGIIKSVDDSGWGMQYEAGGEYLLYKSLGIGVKYKYAQADLLGTTFKNDSTVFMMIFGY
jgi:hypothetical protein